MSSWIPLNKSTDIYKNTTTNIYSGYRPCAFIIIINQTKSMIIHYVNRSHELVICKRDFYFVEEKKVRCCAASIQSNKTMAA